MMTKGEKMCSSMARCKPGVLTTVLGLFVGSNIAMAQISSITPPMYSPLDKNGVHPSTAQFQKSSVVLSLGNPEFSGIAVTDQWYGGVSRDGSGDPPYSNNLNSTFSYLAVGNQLYGWGAVYNGKSYVFNLLGRSMDGASLSVDDVNKLYTMTTSDGTVVIFSGHADPSNPDKFSTMGPVATQATEPNGRVTRYVYKWANNRFWLISAANNLGYQIRVLDTLQGSAYRPSALKGINGSVEYCDRLALTCPSLSNIWPTASYTYQLGAYDFPSRVTVTDATGAITSYSLSTNGLLSAIKTPASAVDNISIGYNSNPSGGLPGGGQRIASYSDGVSSYTYDFNFNNQTYVMSGTVTGPGGYRRTVTGRYSSGFLLTDQDAFGRTTSYTDDAATHRITKIVRPEGNSENWVYDQGDIYANRGNITEYRAVAKAGSGLEDIVLTAGYDATCSVATKNTCNKPNWIRDAKGNQTDFTYAPEHGGVLTETRPPDANGVRPQTRYAYVQGNAWVKNSSGGFVKETPVYLLSSVKTCRTSATVNGACAGTSDEVVTSYEYQVGNATKGSNLLQTGVVVTADGQTRRTCFGYDKYGNKISETKPMANLATCP